jgi:hypothetical protein
MATDSSALGRGGRGEAFPEAGLAAGGLRSASGNDRAPSGRAGVAAGLPNAGLAAGGRRCASGNGRAPSGRRRDQRAGVAVPLVRIMSAMKAWKSSWKIFMEGLSNILRKLFSDSMARMRFTQDW